MTSYYKQSVEIEKKKPIHGFFFYYFFCCLPTIDPLCLTLISSFTCQYTSGITSTNPIYNNVSPYTFLCKEICISFEITVLCKICYWNYHSIIQFRVQQIWSCHPLSRRQFNSYNAVLLESHVSLVSASS